MIFERLVDLNGGFNFRDLGGYPARGGRTVRWRQLFRSGSMSALDEADLLRIQDLGIAAIVDLRSSRERVAQPSRLHADARLRVWSRDYESSGADLIAYLASDAAKAELAHSHMAELYRALPYEQADAYKALFEQLATGPLPLLFHCAAGKDRTGVAAALLLEALEVPRETIFADYALTNQYFDRAFTVILASENWFADLRPELIEPALQARPGYLAAMFDTIDANHGSVQAYASDVLALAPETIPALRRRLLD
ncbi:MAG: tyrosine-protein phosphatase [Sphingomonadales bacterium]|nr:MAG: tyrosine-protein phosphatase [Sphingomonadales bacterium]